MIFGCIVRVWRVKGQFGCKILIFGQFREMFKEISFLEIPTPDPLWILHRVFSYKLRYILGFGLIEMAGSIAYRPSARKVHHPSLKYTTSMTPSIYCIEPQMDPMTVWTPQLHTVDSPVLWIRPSTHSKSLRRPETWFEFDSSSGIVIGKSVIVFCLLCGPLLCHKFSTSDCPIHCTAKTNSSICLLET